MLRQLQRSCAALALITMPGNLLPVQDTDGLVPDLEIRIEGFKQGNVLQELTLRVTNVGPAWSDNTSVTIWTEPASAGPRVEGRFVENLSPMGKEKEQNTPSVYELSYRLAAPCSGQKVTLHASLTAGKDWEGDTEKNMANNVIPRAGQDGVVCSGPTSSQSNAVPSDAGPSVLKPAGPAVSKRSILEGALESQVPEHQRPGLHDLGGRWPPLQLDPIVAVTAIQHGRSETEFLFQSCIVPVLSLVQVGWAQWEDECSAVQVAQTALNFDLRQLDEVPNKTIKRAELTFEEKPVRWTSGGGGFEEKGGCVRILGRATQAWGPFESDHLFPNQTIEGHTPGVRAWLVTEQVRRWFANLDPRFGFILRGDNESPQGDDDTSCLSEIGSPKLTIAYEVT